MKIKKLQLVQYFRFPVFISFIHFFFGVIFTRNILINVNFKSKNTMKKKRSITNIIKKKKIKIEILDFDY